MQSQTGSIIYLFVKTGPFARLILFLTTVFSVMALAVIIQKVRMYRRERAKNKAFLYQFNNAEKLQDIQLNNDASMSGVLENICRTGISEFNRLLESILSYPKDTMSSIFIESQFSIIKDHIEKTVSEEVSKMDRYLVRSCNNRFNMPALRASWHCLGHNTRFLGHRLYGSGKP